MIKKLIFLKNGKIDITDFITKHLGTYNRMKPYNIDRFIADVGYESALEKVELASNEWYISATPTVLDNDIWWNEDLHSWEIYFIQKGELKKAQELTDKVLKEFFNMENVFLGGILDNEEDEDEDNN